MTRVRGGSERCPHLREAVNRRRRLIPPEHIYAVDPWRIVERRFHPPFLEQMEAIFSTANGYLGIRATPDEGTPIFDRGTYLNGFYETWPIVYGEEAYGFAKTGQSMLRVPDGTLLKLYVDDEPFDLEHTRLLSFERVLDMRAGTLERHIEFELADGKQLVVRSTRLVSLAHRHLAAICYEVEVRRGPASLTISSELVTPDARQQRVERDPRRARGLGERVLLPTGHRTRGQRALLSFETCASGLRMACAMDHVVESDARVEVEEAECLEDCGRVVFHAEAASGQRLRVYKLLAYHHSGTADDGELRFRTHRTLDRALRDGYAGVAAAQRERVERFWQASDVEVEGDDEVQQAVRFNLFQILQATARVEGYGVPAKGLSGLGYEGHYFWDTEIYVLPFLVYTAPRIARTLLDHRTTQLDAARRRAREVGQQGALYPWRTINGEEASAYYAASTAQYHIDADIVFAADRYVKLTGDVDMMARGFAEIAVETARMWFDLGFYSERKGGYFCINGVTGPDEYNTVVDNNAYTNLMARENLRIAASVVDLLRERTPDRHARLVEATGLEPGEQEEWRRAAELMYVPYDDRAQVHLQDDQFLDQEMWDFANTPPESFPLLLHYHPLVIYRHQVIKQADVVLATFLLGEHFTLEEKRRIFDYYDPLTTGDSSLSLCIQSIMANELGYADKAYRYFADAVVMDLGDIGGNVRDGLHIASLGGTWMALVHGFAGLRDAGGALRFQPRLPEGWARLRFRLRVRNRVLEVDVRHDDVVYRLREGDELEIQHGKERITLRSGTPVTAPLPA